MGLRTARTLVRSDSLETISSRYVASLTCTSGRTNPRRGGKVRNSGIMFKTRKVACNAVGQLGLTARSTSVNGSDRRAPSLWQMLRPELGSAVDSGEKNDSISTQYRTSHTESGRRPESMRGESARKAL